jgi:hypothetical protein
LHMSFSPTRYTTRRFAYAVAMAEALVLAGYGWRCSKP